MKRILIIIFGLAVAAVLLLGWGMFGDQSVFYTGLTHYEWLPTSASDITVYLNRNMSGVFIADFKISEPNFIMLARERHWDIKPISGSESAFQAEAFHEGRPNDKKVITDGLFYSQRAANGGGITAAYDRETGRAYIDSSSR